MAPLQGYGASQERVEVRYRGILHPIGAKRRGSARLHQADCSAHVDRTFFRVSDLPVLLPIVTGLSTLDHRIHSRTKRIQLVFRVQEEEIR